jgi:hypothetical protein
MAANVLKGRNCMNAGSVGRTVVSVTEMSTHDLVSEELAPFPCVYILHEYLGCSALPFLSMTVSQARDIVWWSKGHISPF